MAVSTCIKHALVLPLLGMLMTTLFLGAVEGGNFFRDMDITFGGPRAKILNSGQAMTLSLDNYSGAGCQSKNEYLFGRFDMQMKLVPNNSAGTVTTFYMSSQGPNHDEIDLEFLGNSTGQPYTLHTNIFCQGKGNREQQFRLWFDPTKALHTYSIVWNSKRIIILVDNVPIRVFNNLEAPPTRVPFPDKQPMRVYSSIWNADDWATMGGRVKTDWTQAPFVASYGNFNANGCVAPTGCSATTGTGSGQSNAWENQELDAAGRNRIRWVQNAYMIYNYCTDKQRFPRGVPPECKVSRFL